MEEEGQIPKSACLRPLISEKQRPGLWGNIPPAPLAWKQKVELGSHPLVTFYGPLRTGILGCLGSGSATGPEIDSVLSWSTGNVEDYTT